MIRKRNRLPIFAVILALVSSPCGTAAQRSIPDDNLAYPVLISVGDGSSGSGFFLNTSDYVYLVTAKHVLFNASNQLLSPHLDLLSYSKDPADLTKNRISVDLSILQSNGDLRPHPTQDVVVARIFRIPTLPTPPPTVQSGATPPIPPVATSTAKPGQTNFSGMSYPLPGVSIQSLAPSGILGVAINSIKTFNQVLAGNEVMLFGYPSSLALQQLQQLDPTRPLLRKGIVAGTNPERESIVLDCPVYPGNSGGPVLELDHDAFTTRLMIIGVVNQYVPFVQNGGSQTFAMQLLSNSGYSIITPMDFVLELTH